MVAARGPLRRTTPSPPRPGGVATATIVSSGVNTLERTPKESEVRRKREGFASFCFRNGVHELDGGCDYEAANTHGLWPPICWADRSAAACYRSFADIKTVFRKASPMLSEDTVGSSATARCTIRRA